MRLHKLKAGETTGTYLVESPLTEADILLMAQQLASQRFRKGRQLTSPPEVFSHLKTLLEAYEHEVFALLMMDSKHRIIAFHELFRGTIDGASVCPREVVKLALQQCGSGDPGTQPPLGRPRAKPGRPRAHRHVERCPEFSQHPNARPYRGWQ